MLCIAQGCCRKMSVCHTPVFCRNNSIYHQTFFTTTLEAKYHVMAIFRPVPPPKGGRGGVEGGMKNRDLQPMSRFRTTRGTDITLTETPYSSVSFQTTLSDSEIVERSFCDSWASCSMWKIVIAVKRAVNSGRHQPPPLKQTSPFSLLPLLSLPLSPRWPTAW